MATAFHLVMKIDVLSVPLVAVRPGAAQTTEPNVLSITNEPDSLNSNGMYGTNQDHRNQNTDLWFLF